jgi:membrane protein
MISAVMLLLVIIPIGLSKLPDFVNFIGEYNELLDLIRYSFVLLSLFFTACSLYYIIPNTRIRFIEVIPGAFLTVILWILSGYLLSRYIVYYNQLNIVYGSLGSVIVTLIFFYIINMIFIYGAEFNYLMSSTKTRFKNETPL